MIREPQSPIRNRRNLHEHPAEQEEPKEGYHRIERAYGSFLRRFRLPDYVDQDKINATCESGVLKIVLTKTPGAKKGTRLINIQ